MKRITNKPPRWKNDHAIYFLTFCTFKRRKILHLDGVAAALIEDLFFYQRTIKELIAYTVMPDHVHLLVEIEDVKTLSKFLQNFKTHSSKRIKELIGKSDGPVWQRGSMDHCIRESVSNSDFENHLNYLFNNSQKHLGISPQDFPFHNVNAMIKRGWIEEGFSSVSEKIEQEFAIYE
jgi:putative transposase